jgi:hypothetical protein
MSERVRHLWVRPEQSPTEMPGLVLECRQNPDWEALVTYIEPGGRVITDWVPEDQVRSVVPAGSE